MSVTGGDNQNKKRITRLASIAVAIVCLALATALYNRNAAQRHPHTLCWFYDSDTGKLYPKDRHTLPPADAPSGKEGFQAFVFACGECTESSRKIGYLTTYEPELKQSLINQELIDPALLMRGQLVRRLEDKKWHSMTSVEGQAIVAAASKPCGETPPSTCNPD